MTTLQTLEMALKALEVEQTVYLRAKLPEPKYLTKAITSLRQQIALEKMAENERELGIQMQPVKMVAYNCKCGRTMKFESEHGVIAPKREWVGLTDEEIQDSVRLGTISHNRHKYSVRGQQITPADDPLWHVARSIQAKLKEKNT